MTLMEVVLALGVFALAALALVGTLNQIALTGMDQRRNLEVDQQLESLIDEYSKMPQIRELDEQIKPGADGIGYRVLITQVKDLKNQDGRFLQNTFRIQAFARWNEGYGPIEVQAETLRYAGAYLPMQ
jgi:Tfp pilus assembly protein PilV